MFKHYFERIENVEIAPVISLILFFVLFIGILIWVLRADKNYIKKMKNLPFDDGETDAPETNLNN